MLLFSTTCLVRHTVYETPFHGLVALPAFAKAETKVQLSFETSQKSHGQQMVAGTASSLGPSSEAPLRAGPAHLSSLSSAP